MPKLSAFQVREGSLCHLMTGGYVLRNALLDDFVFV